MLTDDLYDTVLIAPAREGANKLSIISGFASAAFASRHLTDVFKLASHPRIRLIIGMFPQIGNLGVNHPAFKTLSSTDFPMYFECRYVVEPPPVHVKAYSWFRNDDPVCGFVGSSNYSNKGFGQTQREAVTLANAAAVQDYFDSLWDTALDCRERLADELVEKAIEDWRQKSTNSLVQALTPRTQYVGLSSVTLLLIEKKSGKVPSVSGLNWGQRKGRERNQAYISIPSDIARSDFFPPMKIPFTVLTDDDKSLICVREQPKIKGGTVGLAITTPNSNSELGLYFRNRLGVASGAFITNSDLVRYGRNDVTFYKIDDETFYMDFS